MENIIVLSVNNPVQKAGILSKLTFGWFTRLCKKCVKGGLNTKDIYRNSILNKSSLLTKSLENNWNHQIELSKITNTNPSLLKALRKTFFWKYALMGLLQLLQMAVFRPIQPALLAVFISLFSDESNNLQQMYIYGCSFLILSLVLIFLYHHTDLALFEIGMRVRIACSSLIYRKLLRLGQASFEQDEDASGQITNLLSNDVNRFDLVSNTFHHIWIMPILVLVSTYFVWVEVRFAGLVGILVLLLLTFPVYLYVGNLLSKLRSKVALRTDKRVNKMAEIVSGIEVIKMYAWENFFANAVNKYRIDEISFIKKMAYLRGLISCSSIFFERFILFIMLTTYVLFGNNITAAKVFSLAQIINLLQLSSAIYFPLGINYTAECLISIKRLENYLLKPEQFTPEIQRNDSKEISLENVSASWNTATPVLKNINMKIGAGSLCAIVGPVGVGKSTLLQLLLGELVQDTGVITVGGEVSYASQKPWLFASSVRQNILFGKAFDSFLYRTVIKVCALRKDFELLPYGDETLVGDKGVSLSGGQKARINLARAVYKDADIYLLDDPLSAVDSHVGKELFKNCILNHLKNKTRILVTHQLHYLKQADHIIVLNRGKIEAQGTFEELSTINLDFTNLFISPDPKEEKPIDTNDNILTTSVTISTSTDYKSGKKEDQQYVEETIVKYDKKVFWEYLRAGGNVCMLIFLVILYVAGQISANSIDLWVTFWTSQDVCTQSYQLNSTTDICISKKSQYKYIYVYTSLICICIVIITTAALYLNSILMRASRNLHFKMFSSLLRVPMKFFDTNPSGRILNRFSRDIGIIDDLIPPCLQTATQIILVMIGILVMVFITNPFMIPVALMLSIIFNKLRKWYAIVARNTKHIEGITKSPVFSHISATWNGIVTIRSSQMQNVLKEEFDLHQDTHSSAWYLTLVCTQAFGLWIDFVSFIFLSLLILGFIAIQHYTPVSGSIVGLAISQATILIGMVQFGMGKLADTISQMTSVERVLEYTNLEGEEPQYKQYEPKPALWPYEGNIRFEQVCLSYSQNNPDVLKNLNFEIKAKEKIGIVGRTGAGKSSIILSLFRLYPIRGSIIIDGIDTKDISLNVLRNSISIIPQDPVLFSATLRYNLDPFNQYSDEEIWNTLQKMELKDAVPSLGYSVQEGGSNFSVGQRQLICLARATLRKTKILVLDEATANVDIKTDCFIQKAIKTTFRDCTVITVAHRLDTIMVSTRVMVMDAGSIVEFDSPDNLLKNKTGHFYKMAVEGNVLPNT